MSKINVERVALGGAVAGIVIFILTGVVNGAVLSGELKNWMRGMGSLIHPPAQSFSMCLWALMSLIVGIAGVWIYAGIRPRYGAGPRTAMLAGFSLWTVGKLAVALDFIALGLLPGRIVAGQLIGGFVTVLLGVFFGAWTYKE